MKDMFGRRRDYALAPLYYIQARRVAKHALKLPEPNGTCHIIMPNVPTLAILGDSAAAGVGVDGQEDAPLGRIFHHLGAQDIAISCHLYATSGHTSFDLLQRLYAMPITRIDIAIISIGVNDVVKATTNKDWQYNLNHIITLLTRKFRACHIIFLSLPPMHLAPSLPIPLNAFIGRRAQALTQLLKSVCDAHEQAHYVTDEFKTFNLSPHHMFAKDGFHPSKQTYDIWSRTLANKVAELLPFI